MSEESLSVSGIYALCCPKTGDVRYIGQSKNIKKRFSAHLNSSTKYPVSSWVEELKKQNLFPILKIIKECPPEKLDEEEIQEIKKHKGNLLNVSNGGKMGYSDLSRKKPWSVKGVANPTKLVTLFIRNRNPKSSVLKQIKDSVANCKSDAERCELELRFAHGFMNSCVQDKIDKWAREAIPKMKEAGYV